MGFEIKYDEGQTPIDENEKQDLKIKSITTQGELDEFEQLNIEKAVEWTIRTNLKPERMNVGYPLTTLQRLCAIDLVG